MLSLQICRNHSRADPGTNGFGQPGNFQQQRQHDQRRQSKQNPKHHTAKHIRRVMHAQIHPGKSDHRCDSQRSQPKPERQRGKEHGRYRKRTGSVTGGKRKIVGLSKGLARSTRFFSSALQTSAENTSDKSAVSAARLVCWRTSRQAQAVSQRMPPFPRNVAIFIAAVSQLRRKCS